MEHRLLSLVRYARDARPDADLLASARDDRAAFAELVARYGPLVWGVCRRMLGEADAEDAFQATFIALLRSIIRDKAAVASWLHAVAVRISLSARKEAGRRRARERAAAAPEAVPSREPDDRADTMAVVHQEVAALPEIDRSAFVLCVVQGMTQAEASARLGRTPGAIAGQVARARKRLIAKLTERGVAPGLVVLGATSVADAVPPELVERLLNLPGAGVPPSVLRLTKGVVGMSASSKRLILAVACAVCVVCAALGFHLSAAAPPAEQQPVKEDKPVVAPKAAEGDRVWKGRLTEKGTGKPIAGAEVVVTLSGADDKTLRKVTQKTGADGGYEFTITAQEAANGQLYVELTITAQEHTEFYGGYGYGLILKNEKLGQRAFFEHIALAPGKAIEGIVKTPEGKPAAGVKVKAYTAPNFGKNGAGGKFPETKTDAKGHFRLVILSEGRAVFWILPQNHAPEVHGVEKDQRGDLGAFTLSKGERLTGKLRDSEGKPVGGVYVEAQIVRKKENKDDVIPNNVANQIHRAAVTAPDGSFEFRPLPVGTYRITPTEQGWDPSTQQKSQEAVRKPLTAVFTPRAVALKPGAATPPVEIRAVPHVVLEFQMRNSKGEKCGGSDINLFGMLDAKRFWNTSSSCTADGAYRILAPKGLDDATFSLISNEHTALQFRTKKGAPLQYSRDCRLGTLDQDMKELEIIRYVAPIILINATTKDGKPIKDMLPSVDYTDPNHGHGSKFIYKGKARTDVPFEERGEGKVRTIQLVPDREVNVTVQAEGFKPVSRKITLAEGKTEEMNFILEPK